MKKKESSQVWGVKVDLYKSGCLMTLEPSKNTALAGQIVESDTKGERNREGVKITLVFWDEMIYVASCFWNCSKNEALCEKRRSD